MKFYFSNGPISGVVFLTIFMLFCTQAQSQDRISPFGDLEWEDSLSDVNRKIHSMQGIEKVEVVFHQDRSNGVVLHKNSDLGAAITSLFKKSRKAMLLNANDGRVKGYLKSYIDKDGKKKLYIPAHFDIVASPVVIVGIPYKLSANFVVNPGVAIDRSKNVIVANSGRYFYALTLKEVQLSSDAPGLEKGTKAIRATINSKYRKFYNEDLRFPLDDKAEIEVSGHKFLSDVRYKEFGYTKILNETYKKHLEKLQSENLKTKGDARSKL